MITSQTYIDPDVLCLPSFVFTKPDVDLLKTDVDLSKTDVVKPHVNRTSPNQM